MTGYEYFDEGLGLRPLETGEFAIYQGYFTINYGQSSSYADAVWSKSTIFDLLSAIGGLAVALVSGL